MSWRHRGPMKSATSWTPSQPCGVQMLTNECVTDKCHARGCNLPTAPSANSLTLVPTGTTEYIAAGDSQAAVPFPTEIRRDFDLQWKTASGLYYLLLQLAVTAGKRAFQRRALWRPHPARREVTCGDTDMDWLRLGAVLHTTGLWGRSYLGVGRRAASRTWQKGRHGFTMREIFPWKNTHMGLPEEESGHTDT